MEGRKRAAIGRKRGNEWEVQAETFLTTAPVERLLVVGAQGSSGALRAADCGKVSHALSMRRVCHSALGESIDFSTRCLGCLACPVPTVPPHHHPTFPVRTIDPPP